MIRFWAIFTILTLPTLFAQSASLEARKKKAGAGDLTSQFFLGEDYNLGLGGLEPDGKESERYYKMAAEQGMSGAQYALAVLYFEGQMIPQNYA